MKVIGALYSFFGKAFVYRSSKNVSPKELSSLLRIYPGMMRNLQDFNRNYSDKEAVKIINVLEEYDLKSKGVDYSGGIGNHLLTEMVYKILN